MSSNKLKLVLCWHMHQPHYKDGLDGEYRLPWVYLHAIKDYTDMAAYLEFCPGAKAVINFIPVLIDQIKEYAEQLQGWLKNGEPMCDGFLNLVAGVKKIPSKVSERAKIIEDCQRAYAPTMIHALPDFKHLVNIVEHKYESEEEKAIAISYLDDQFFVDLLVWYHIAWMGASLKKSDERIQKLIQKKRYFCENDQRLLIEIMADALKGIIPRYKKLQDRGQIEISMTPYGHPIVPLLLDFKTTYDAMPDASMPVNTDYPGGYGRAKWHMKKGLEVFIDSFGKKPEGVWLSEGALSEDAIGVLDEFGIRWTASGEGVWRHSYEASGMSQEALASKDALYQPSKLPNKDCVCFFRDDGLSDLIGFQYKDWSPEDAANNFEHHLTNIAKNLGDHAGECVVPVILDGENAWEYYPDNAYQFLTKLYQKLSSSENIEMVTFSEALKPGVRIHELPALKAGSWVYGSFSTWIGDKDKNRGWDLLIDAKNAYDETLEMNCLPSDQVEAATEQLAICEGSDWFWWFGDYNPSDSVRDFDELYRRHLKKLYTLLNKEIPSELDIPLSKGGRSAENAGTMRRNA